MRPVTLQRALRRRGPNGGFTLLEVVVTAAVASIIFVMLTRWVLTLSAVASAGLETSTPGRAAAYTDFRISADIGSATVCDAGTSNPVRTLSPDTLELYTRGVDSAGRPQTYLVRWRVASATLTRTQTLVQPDLGQCGPGGPSYGERVMATNVRTPNAAKPAFTALVEGATESTCQPVTVTADDGTSHESPQGEACFADALTVDLVMLSTGTDPAPVAMTKSYQVSAGGGAL